MFKSVLVPLDGSAFAEHALPMAMRLAQPQDTTIHLVRVHIPLRATYAEGVLFYDEEMEAHFREQDQQYLELVAKRLRTANPDLKVECHLLEGEIGDALVGAAAQHQCDLVVMTTHGRGALARVLIGSTTDQMLRRLTDTPILLIKPADGEVSFDTLPELSKILVPLDGSKFAEKILGPAKQVASITGASFIITRIIRPILPGEYPPEMAGVMYNVEAVLERVEQLQKEIREKAEQYLKGVAEQLQNEGFGVETRIDEDVQPAEAILRDSESLPVDLIALSTHARHGLPRLFLGSVANKLIRRATKPLLVYRPADEE